MRSGKYATWKISMCLAQRDKALQTISHETLITYYSRKYGLCVNLFVVRSTCRLESRKLLVRAFPFKACRNTSSFQQQDKHRIQP